MMFIGAYAIATSTNGIERFVGPAEGHVSGYPDQIRMRFPRMSCQNVMTRSADICGIPPPHDLGLYSSAAGAPGLYAEL